MKKNQIISLIILISVILGGAFPVSAQKLPQFREPGKSISINGLKLDDAPATITIGSGEGLQGTSVVIPVSTSLQPGTMLGAATILVRYDPSVVNAITCLPDPGAYFDSKSCNLNYDHDGVNPDIVAFTMISSLGVSGEQLLANITFQI